MEKEIQRIKEALAKETPGSLMYRELLTELSDAIDIMVNENAVGSVVTVAGIGGELTSATPETVVSMPMPEVVEPAPPMVEVPEETETPVSESGKITREDLRKLLVETKERVEKTTLKEITAPYTKKGASRFSLKDVPESEYEALAEALKNAK